MTRADRVESEDIVVGDGSEAVRGKRVEIRYTLRLHHGDLVQENERATFRLGKREVIAGLEYGVEGMRVGGVRHVRVGPHLAYGDAGVPSSIPPNALLRFEITLLSVS